MFFGFIENNLQYTTQAGRINTSTFFKFSPDNQRVWRERLFRQDVNLEKENIPLVNYWIVNPFVTESRTVPLESKTETV